MFTNWLTGTTGGAAAAAATGTNQNPSENRTGPPNSNLPNNTGNNGNGHILMSTPPDVILEVGTVPNTVRFVAHSIVLGMHSGYLRSAIRLDDRTTSNSSPDFVLYLGNVTAEQFAPLLTYMYTGYLDLNIENIFCVLLATHVLHMPRALEICRAFLARAQTEGYLGARLNSLNVVGSNANSSSNGNGNGNGSGKIIRPIASKPTLPNFAFLPSLPPPPPPPTTALAQQQPTPTLLTPGQLLANFKGLQQRQNPHEYLPPPTTMAMMMTMTTQESTQQQNQQQRAKSVEIDVDQESTDEIGDNSKDANRKQDDEDDDEDEEVFIDSSDTDTDNDDTEVIIECRSNKKIIATASTTAAAAAAAPSKCENAEHTRHVKNLTSQSQGGGSNSSSSKITRPQQHSSRTALHATKSNDKRDKRRTAAGKSRTNSGLQIAKAPIPASQLDANEGSKVIIDVASCDGPVRFRRILNTAYGHKPEDFATQMPERSQQSVSYSFHQQMARTINQQQRQQMQKQQSGGEESENSESSNGGGKTGNSSKGTNAAATANGPTEIYVCVYCKHTFKSQYCYQKHAKRHLNPLSLNAAERCSEKATAIGVYPHAAAAGTLPLPLAASKQNATELLRREVRPLDMNVQYYPCKTCGSKFPSYYFVHKHRKMCHADEEATATVKENTTTQGNNNGGGGGGGGGDMVNGNIIETDHPREDVDDKADNVGDNRHEN